MSIHPLHDPTDRIVIGHLHAATTDAPTLWEVRQFAERDSRLQYFAEKGFAHVQLWQPSARVSIVTPSRLTGGMFEMFADGDRFTARMWATMELELAVRDVPPPGRHAVRALERWFVLPTETRAGRLLRSWWAGAEETAR